MILWTIVPLEWVLDDDPAVPQLVEVPVGRMRVLVEAGADGGARIHRLLSTDPADYLHPELQPGAPWPAPPLPAAP
ncbi:MAG TPA: YlzJ-like family protein [Limnochordales bacterium]